MYMYLHNKQLYICMFLAVHMHVYDVESSQEGYGVQSCSDVRVWRAGGGGSERGRGMRHGSIQGPRKPYFKYTRTCETSEGSP